MEIQRKEFWVGFFVHYCSCFFLKITGNCHSFSAHFLLRKLIICTLGMIVHARCAWYSPLCLTHLLMIAVLIWLVLQLMLSFLWSSVNHVYIRYYSSYLYGQTFENNLKFHLIGLFTLVFKCSWSKDEIILVFKYSATLYIFLILWWECTN